jgi:putative ABC transport system permease protein
VAAVPTVEGSFGDLAEGTVAIDQGKADEEGLGVGDAVELDFPNGKESLEVVAVYGDDDPVLWTPYATTLDTLVDAGYPAADSYLLINVSEGADLATVQEAVEEQTSELPTVTVKDQAGFAEEQRAPIDQMLLLIYALLGPPW